MSSETSFHYQLPTKSIKTDCPQCSPKYRKTLSRYVDTRKGELLPEQYGRCDRESKCGYHLNPYHNTASGSSYADEADQRWKPDNFKPIRPTVRPNTAKQENAPAPVYSIPDALFRKSLGHYEHNQFAQLLKQQFGQSVANALLDRFQVGTSKHWPGACIFWYIDEQNRKRGGQIKLFGSDWHTVKYTDREGTKRSKTSWVHYARKCRLEQAGLPLPNWLTEYEEKAERSPCLFGLPQLLTAPIEKPIAVVEAPKTAIVCTHFMPDFTWLAVGSLSYLNAERLAPLRGRKIMLYPDLNAFANWHKRVDTLKAEGLMIEVSSFLEEKATDEKKQAGLDLADFLLFQQPPTVSTVAEQLTNPGTVLKADESQIERLPISPCDSYPAEWDAPNPPGTVPTIQQRTFHE